MLTCNKLNKILIHDLYLPSFVSRVAYLTNPQNPCKVTESLLSEVGYKLIPLEPHYLVFKVLKGILCMLILCAYYPGSQFFPRRITFIFYLLLTLGGTELMT